jgi:hypothetical protein
MELQPMNIGGGYPDYFAGILLFHAANLGQTLAAHVGIVGTFVIVSVDKNVNIVVLFGKQSKSASATKRIVIGVRGKEKDGLALQLLKRHGRSLRTGNSSRKNGEQKGRRDSAVDSAQLF